MGCSERHTCEWAATSSETMPSRADFSDTDSPRRQRACEQNAHTCQRAVGSHPRCSQARRRCTRVRGTHIAGNRVRAKVALARHELEEVSRPRVVPTRRAKEAKIVVDSALMGLKAVMGIALVTWRQ